MSMPPRGSSSPACAHGWPSSWGPLSWPWPRRPTSCSSRPRSRAPAPKGSSRRRGRASVSRLTPFPIACSSCGQGDSPPKGTELVLVSLVLRAEHGHEGGLGDLDVPHHLHLLLPLLLLLEELALAADVAAVA